MADPDTTRWSDPERIFRLFVDNANTIWERTQRRQQDAVVPLTRRKSPHESSVELVPDVSSVRPPPAPPREKSEDGQIPAGELDRALADMNVLLRYGYTAQVRDQLDELFSRYPNDLLLLRRIAEFHLETEDTEAAMDALFTLARRLFERHNLEGMRRALEQVLVLNPKNRRAYKLLGLLDERPSTGTGG